MIAMRDKLRRRLPDESEGTINVLAEILDRYDLTPTVHNIDSHGFIFNDLKDRPVRVVEATHRGTSLHLSAPHAQIVIIHIDGLVAGWIESVKLEDLEDRFAVELKSLSPLPETLSFDQQCSHLVDHGGYNDGDHWICFGCEKVLV